jgi:Na+-transporting methylmalonyl-CoA/oxaloacetate decarboxylase gamma subunit
MNRKYIGIFIVVLSLILLGFIIYFIFIYNFSPASAPEEEAKPAAEAKKEFNKITPEPQAIQPKIYQDKQIKRTVSEADLRQIAASFAERFGSYSNQSDFSNIEDLKLFMSRRMKNWADGYISDLKSKRGESAIYYGITTKAVSAEIKNYDQNSAQAQILVKTQRREAVGTTNNASNKYEDIKISLIKENGAWKIDEARWEK